MTLPDTPLDYYDEPEPTEPEAPSASQPAEAAGGDEIDALLAEYKAANGDAPSADTPQQHDQSADNAPTRELSPIEQQLVKLGEASAGDWKDRVENWITGVDQERFLARERADNDIVVAQARKVVEEVAPHLYGDDQMIGGWLMAEYHTDPKVQRDWDRRYNSPADMKACEQRIDRVLRKFAQHLKSIPDPNATADRNMVAASMRGAASAADLPPPKPTNYKSMSNQDFVNDTETKYGFRPPL